MANYADIAKNTNPQAIQGGYKDVVLFAPLADFLSLKKPTPTPTALGDLLTIDEAHTFTSPKGFHNWASKKASVTITAETQGDPGAQQLRHTCVFTILGDGATTQEQMEKMLNDDLIFLVKEANCLVADSYVQLGDECVTPDVSIAFDAANSREGVKAWTVTVAVTGKKFFYVAAVTEAS